MASEEIGGYFELELPRGNGDFPHSDGILVNSGSHAFRLLLRELQPKRVWLPDYTCDVMVKAAEAEGIEIGVYPINNRLEIAEMPEADPERELIVVNDYFGVKDSYVRKIVAEHPYGIVADCAQAFMCELPSSIPAIRSPRKFVGVPDGGILNFNGLKKELPSGSSRQRCESLLTRLEAPASQGYAAFKQASASIHSEELTAMSRLTRRLLESIDFSNVAERRRDNFRILSEALGSRNPLTPFMDPEPEMPMVYPFMTDNPELRRRLIENKIYVARYWPEYGAPLPEGSIAPRLADEILPLPIDQRYDSSDMRRILDILAY